MRALTSPNWKPLGRTGDAELVAAIGQDHIVERGAREQRTGWRHTEAERQRDLLVAAVSLAHHLPHVRAGRYLERADIAPAEIHPVVSDVGAVVERLAGDAPDAGADRQLLFQRGMADRYEVFVDVGRVGDHHLLTGRLRLQDLARRQRLRQRPRQFPGPLLVARPAEHGVDDIDVAEQIGENPVVRLGFHIVEDDRAAAIHQFLEPGHFQVGVDFLVGLDQLAAVLEPCKRAPQILKMRATCGLRRIKRGTVHCVVPSRPTRIHSTCSISARSRRHCKAAAPGCLDDAAPDRVHHGTVMGLGARRGPAQETGQRN